MAKVFNTSVTCNPKIHYMVDTTAKMKVFERLIDNKCYFTINRARQFGKSTSLNWILHNMSQNYLVVPISFETESDVNWQNDGTFFKFFCGKLAQIFTEMPSSDTAWIEYWEKAQAQDIKDFDNFSVVIKQFCKSVGRKVVLTIDEVDKASNNDVFLRFLGMLRNMYLDREKFSNYSMTFWSVVLTGVYDVKNLKLKIRPEEEHQFNSPWNVAANYKLDMTFNPQEISTMLADYENDYHIGFDIKVISEEIYKYTSGYPVLVSRICKEIDEYLDKDWSIDGVLKAVKNIVKEKSTLIESITDKLETYSKLKVFIRALIMENYLINFDVNNPTMDMANMFSIIKADNDGRVVIHNLIFQQVLINYFISENQINQITPGLGFKVFIDKHGDLNMPLIINRFKDLMSKKQNKEEFLEKEGRFMFICFLKPIVNGTGFYYSEPENDDGSRMDLVVNYNRKEYVIELKIWHGTEYEISGREQISEYLATRNLSEGYLVTFSFLKNKVVQEKPEWIEYGGKRIYEAVI